MICPECGQELYQVVAGMIPGHWRLIPGLTGSELCVGSYRPAEQSDGPEMRPPADVIRVPGEVEATILRHLLRRALSALRTVDASDTTRPLKPAELDEVSAAISLLEKAGIRE